MSIELKQNRSEWRAAMIVVVAAMLAMLLACSVIEEGSDLCSSEPATAQGFCIPPWIPPWASAPVDSL